MLTEQTLSTGTTTIKTSPKANCFGAGTAGSGKSVTVKGATALGLLGQASKSTGSLRPLLVTDAFDFGLGICGVGASKVSGKASWYLKVNHKGATVSGDAVKLQARRRSALGPGAVLPVPERAGPGRARHASPPACRSRSRVYSYDEKGKRKPVSGATVTGASGPTDAGGKATVTLSAHRFAGRDPRQGHPLAAPWKSASASPARRP